MNSTFSRRRFLRSSAFASLGLAGAGLGLRPSGLAMEPIHRSGSPRLQLSLAAYSFRQFFKDGRGGGDPQGERSIDLFDFIDFCAAQGCVGTELTSYYFPTSTDRDYLLRIKRHAFMRGIAISGTAVGNRFTLPPGEERDRQIAHVKQWVDYAAIMGAPHIRIFAGNAAEGMTMAQAKALSIEAIEECCDYAGRQGVFLGLENHGGIVSEPKDLLDIVRAVQSPWFGINLDTGNFHTEDPYAALAQCAPYAVNVQVKVEMSARNRKQEKADFKRLIRILREVNYQGYVALEYEAAPDPWETVPGLLKELSTAMKP